MRIRVDHATSYTYDRPASGIVQLLRLTPSNHDAQHIIDWRIDVDADGVLRPHRDAHGNCCHMFYAEHPIDRLVLRVTGEAETSDSVGVVNGSLEPLPPTIYLRSTPLTHADPVVQAFADDTIAGQAEPLVRLHQLNVAINSALLFDAGATGSGTGAAQALALGRGVCQDHAQLLIACARWLGMPARYVSGHLVRRDGAADQPAAHAWAEAWVNGLGWIAFDPANGISPDDAYIRVAVGLDALDASPVRGARRGGGDETLTVTVRAENEADRVAGRLTQSQSQSQS